MLVFGVRVGSTCVDVGEVCFGVGWWDVGSCGLV